MDPLSPSQKKTPASKNNNQFTIKLKELDLPKVISWIRSYQ